MNNRLQIINIINAYISAKQSSHAIMIDGGWGSGKTTLIKDIFIKNSPENKIVYTSLFGLKSVEDIEKEIFKFLSISSNSTNEMIKVLDSQSISYESIKVGGIGSVVQYLLKLRKERMLSNAKSQVFCFDDLERWDGDITTCLSYINKLVEQHGAKCIIVGCSENLTKPNKISLANALEKTVGNIYMVSNLKGSKNTIFDISIINAISCELNYEVIDIILSNINFFFETLMISKCDNIRLITECIILFNAIYINNKSAMNISKLLTTNYFNMLLATKILVTKYYKEIEKKDKFLNLNLTPENNYESLSILGYFNKSKNKDTEISKEEKELLDIIFNYGESSIKLGGIFSIIKNSYYVASDFRDEFSKWSIEKNHDKYLQVIDFYSRDDIESRCIFLGTIIELFIKKEIKNPATIVVLAHRVTCDIMRGVIKYKLERASSHFIKLIDWLYQENLMDRIPLNDSHFIGSSFDYSQKVYCYVMEKNKKYVESTPPSFETSFWDDILNNPSETMEIINNSINTPIFITKKSPKDILEILNTLSNGQLFDFTRAISERYTKAQSDSIKMEIEIKAAEAFANHVKSVYQDEFSVKSSHFKQIARVILTGSNNYNSEHLNNIENE
ncbi:P-loop NTPase fold protein [Pectobacterium carotovorum]|uniref:P-loop NTPase fold protein n=1 Tax=Pectobacterium carotovorum TaxID=554 RepID=UPI00057DF571|nr:P-loop NTPase fold protein [Pectobacterium carotovorum]KHT33659.1 hypothetical protein RD01_01825 [Pectobacterium carotovorum subsp. carotovorum]